MAENDLDCIRQQYLKRALSIVVRNSEFDSVTACSLDVLCNVGILYMQSMFSQVHAYAEHATRTRPNMNDVGRALEERNVSVGQLDAYYRSEAEARLDTPVAAAVDTLRQQSGLLATAGDPAATHVEGGPSLFFDNRAEDLLRRLVANHKASIEEHRRKEQARLLAEKAANRLANATSRLPAHTPSGSAASTMRLDNRSRPNARRRVGMRTTGDIEDDDDDEDEDDDGNDNEDEDDEGEEDADFEAPMVSAPHPRSPDLAATDVDMEVSRRLQQPGHSAGDDESTRINNRPMGEVATETTAESPESAAPPVDDVERLLLPLAMLPEHIPAQCPPFPSPHTYKQTPVYPEREQDFFRNRMQKAEQSRQAEENLQRLINGSRRGHGMPPASTDTAEPVGEGTQKAKQTARERLEELFPPANFRNTCKRTRLTGYIQ